MDTTDTHPLGTHLGTLLSARAKKMGLRVDILHDTSGVTGFTRHDVIGERSGEDWFCFSLILMPDRLVGIWTREMMGKNQDPIVALPIYEFDSSTFDAWLDRWFENAALDELTKPK